MNASDNEDVMVCRCEEVTMREVLEALRDGAEGVRGIKIRTRAGMGLCQGRTCSKILASVLKKHGHADSSSGVLPNTVRPPVYPIEWGQIVEGDRDEESSD